MFMIFPLSEIGSFFGINTDFRIDPNSSARDRFEIYSQNQCLFKKINHYSLMAL